eukprot:CAMPEP_0170083216 /NCGR_PEP_ID=MMETSP0019_2-20121128/18610_1 /TAXON_ID=98059 /ORGANISM="Dinobryon sp., Strain UTEXLB2267" /LENGTH=86 /DNA_ID=CAMNT_0010298477 /DNA_START=434 /DNA_END=694 /DNA_ORIENTATION=-
MAAAVLFRPTLLWLRNINEKQLLIEKKDSKKPKLITREIVFLSSSPSSLTDAIHSLKSCKIVEDIQAVLGMKISFGTVDNNGLPSS